MKKRVKRYTFPAWSMTTLQCKLELSRKDKEVLKDLMRRQSACTRYAYKRLLKGKGRNKLNKDIKLLLSSLESEWQTQEPADLRKEQVRGGAKAPQKLWRAVRVALAIPLLGKSLVRDLSPLRSVLVLGDWKRVAVRLAPVLGAGAMTDPNAACWGLGLSEGAGYKYPSLKRNFTL